MWDPEEPLNKFGNAGCAPSGLLTAFGTRTGTADSSCANDGFKSPFCGRMIELDRKLAYNAPDEVIQKHLCLGLTKGTSCEKNLSAKGEAMLRLLPFMLPPLCLEFYR